ncbi:MAG: hypothetical protein JTJ21_00380, partial [Holdemanella sp.]|nr:hypothetical protein [Holdemanella sp.]
LAMIPKEIISTDCSVLFSSAISTAPFLSQLFTVYTLVYKFFFVKALSEAQKRRFIHKISV